MTRQERAAWAFAGPVLLLIALVFVLPTAIALALSVTDYSIYALADWSNLHFIGLGNFRELLKTPLFWRALKNTLLFAALGGPMAMCASLAAGRMPPPWSCDDIGQAGVEGPVCHARHGPCGPGG